MPDTAARYRFGPFLLEPALRRLLRDSAEITLTPKAFDILILLVGTRDRVLTKQELLDAVWPDTAVTENTLTQRIREIREALDDDAQEPRYVRTVSRVGYRFVGEVTEECSAALPRREPVGDAPPVGLVEPAPRAEPQPVPAAPAAEDLIPGVLTGEPGSIDGGPVSVQQRAARVRRARWAVYTAALTIIVLAGLAAWFVAMRRRSVVDGEPRIASIAVLPLENLSHDAGQDYFADGMTDELITELARIRTLRVISRTSALRYRGSTKSVRQIGSELNVDALVEGSVLRAGQQARITLKLIDVATDRTLLAESYARELQDILALQSEIARAVAERIRATVAPEARGRVTRRVVPEAYDEYLRARASWWKRTPEGVKQALLLFQRAIERDPTYAAAWAGMADCYIVFSGALLGLPEREAYSRARGAAIRALELDDTLAEAHTSLGSIKSEYDWDWPGAEAEYTRALAINASYVTARQWYGVFLSFHGRHDESLAQLEHARQLDPLSPVVSDSLAIGLLMARRYDEAIAQARRTLAIDPAFAGSHLTLGSAYLQQGQHAEAISALERAVTLAPDMSRPLGWLGHAYGVAGHRRKAQHALEQLEALSKRAPVSSYDIALVHMGLGDVDRTFARLEDAYAAHAWELIQLKVDMRFDRIHSDPRFTDLIRRIGLNRVVNGTPKPEGQRRSGTRMLADTDEVRARTSPAHEDPGSSRRPPAPPLAPPAGRVRS